ncbi:MAG: hypothetical protein ABIG95_03925 [Candidatus Woesearchaeota archaeon]
MDTMPIFVKIDEYKDVLEVLRQLSTKVEQAKKVVEKINELKNEEDSAIEMWQKQLSEVEERLGNIGKKLVEPGI